MTAASNKLQGPNFPTAQKGLQLGFPKVVFPDLFAPNGDLVSRFAPLIPRNSYFFLLFGFLLAGNRCLPENGDLKTEFGAA